MPMGIMKGYISPHMVQSGEDLLSSPTELACKGKTSSGSELEAEMYHLNNFYT